MGKTVDKMKPAKTPCPFCHGEVWMNYKSNPNLNKCCKCHRMLSGRMR